ncbi:MAG: Sec-independent protein translocase protein TatB [Epsilonproteobacteria bacterium]|nr:Sec-independent protein translocase protein TatB [Campylobacterota bacterium]
MFGLGFMEIFVILVVAIIALGPEKLPTVAVDVARFLKKLKSGVEDAKSVLDNELNLSSLKEEATNLKSHMNFDRLADLDLDEPKKSESKKEETAQVQSKKEEIKG